MVADLRLGMIGFSEGNGHPFSFSAIFNGYDSGEIRRAGWTVIADYLDRQDPHEVGVPGVSVTAAWAPDRTMAEALARSVFIPEIVEPQDMVGKIDAAIIARDDWRSHAELAMPFLEAGIPVFIDKPLTLDRNELAAFRPHLESGRLMSCSALRYARELDILRANPRSIGTIQLVAGAVLNDFQRYGVHLLEAAIGITGTCPELVDSRMTRNGRHALLEEAGGPTYSLHAMGATAKRFRLSFFGDAGAVEVDIADNYSAFRRCMLHFVEQVRSGKPAIPPEQTVAIIEILLAIEGQVEGRAR